MRKLNGTLAALTLGGALFLGWHSPSWAQDAMPIAPDPSECVVTPRTIDNVVDLFIGGDYAPSPEIAAGALPTGDTAPAEAIEGANSTLRRFLACSNANDLLAMLALATDRGAQFFGPETSEATEEDIRGFFEEMESSPVPEDERELFTPMTEMVVLDDGRIGGVFVTGSPDEGAVYLIFTEIDDVWLIDEIVELPNSATPTT